MSEYILPVPLQGVYNRKRFFTPGVIILAILAINGLVVLALRLFYGIGAVTNLDNLYPWGLWIGVDVAAGVALAAGGFTSAALSHIVHKHDYNVIVRPALLTAMLGYTFVALGVVTDIGRWYYIWHPMIMWNPNSALFEVGICVMIYLTVLYIEFLPVVIERIAGRQKLPKILKPFGKLIDNILKSLDGIFSKTMFIFIIAGVVLSTLHQSSLGTLMIIAGDKIHPLWQTPILPLLFFLSAVAVGFPMIIFESLIASRSFGLKPEMHVLSKLGNIVPALLIIFLAFKIGDMFIRETFFYLTEFNTKTVMFLIEVVIGFVLPLILFLFKRVINSPVGLFIASGLVIFGVLINRINNFITAYTPPYATHSYFPSYGEISLTVGFIALLVLIYRVYAMIFPVISLPVEKTNMSGGRK
jgi:Ni/Fe-hydrogenase subunit HybB-like protein